MVIVQTSNPSTNTPGVVQVQSTGQVITPDQNQPQQQPSNKVTYAGRELNAEYYDSGKVKRVYADERTYQSVREKQSGYTENKSFTPYEATFDENGILQSEIERGTYQQMVDAKRIIQDTYVMEEKHLSGNRYVDDRYDVVSRNDTTNKVQKSSRQYTDISGQELAYRDYAQRPVGTPNPNAVPAKDAMIVQDSEGKVTYASDAVKQTLGKDPTGHYLPQETAQRYTAYVSGKITADQYAQQQQESVDAARAEYAQKQESAAFNASVAQKVAAGKVETAGDIIPKSGVQLTPENIAAIKQNIAASEYNKAQQNVDNQQNVDKEVQTSLSNNELRIFRSDYGADLSNSGNYISSGVVSKPSGNAPKTKEAIVVEKLGGFVINYAKNVGSYVFGYGKGVVEMVAPIFTGAVSSVKYLGGAISFYSSTERYYKSSPYEADFKSFVSTKLNPAAWPQIGANVITGVASAGVTAFSGGDKYEAAGKLSAYITAPEVAGRALGASANVLKDYYVIIRSEKYVPPVDVFAESVLKGQARMPESKSVQDTLNQFKNTKGQTVNVKGYTRVGETEIYVDNPDLASNKFIKENLNEVSPHTRGGKYYASTSAPRSLSGDVAGQGFKARVGAEDPGIYVTPKGQASPYFLEIAGQSPEYSFSANPIKGMFDIPTVTTFEATEIVQYPRSVINQPGFEAVAKYQQEVLANKGVVAVTKRSEIGLGNVERQTYVAKSDYVDPWNKQNIKVGDVVKEHRTTELEGVVPKGTKFVAKQPGFFSKLKIYDAYTTYEGRSVVLRDARLLSSESGTLKVGESLLSDSKIAKGTSALSDASSKVEFRSPYGYASSANSIRELLLSVSNKTYSSKSTTNINKPSSVGSDSSTSKALSSLYLSSGSSSSGGSSGGFSGGSSGGSSGGGSSGGGSSGGSSGGGSGGGSSGGSSGGGSSGGSSGGGGGGGFDPYTDTPGTPRKRKKIPTIDLIPGFAAYEKRFGKFFALNKAPISQGEAFNLAIKETQNTAGVTFFVKPTGTMIKRRPNQFFNQQALREYYTKRKGNKTLYLQKNKFRIRTPGEFRDITAKGLAATRRKKPSFKKFQNYIG
jgi:hypothetical protein